MVYYEVVDGDYNRWMGSIGDCYVGEYAILNERYYEDRDEFEEDYYDYNMEEINEQFGYDPCICKPHIDTGLITKEQYKLNASFLHSFRKSRNSRMRKTGINCQNTNNKSNTKNNSILEGRSNE